MAGCKTAVAGTEGEPPQTWGKAAMQLLVWDSGDLSVDSGMHVSVGDTGRALEGALADGCTSRFLKI